VLHLLTKRRQDLVAARTQTINRLLMDLVPGGARRTSPPSALLRYWPRSRPPASRRSPAGSRPPSSSPTSARWSSASPPWRRASRPRSPRPTPACWSYLGLGRCWRPRSWVRSATFAGSKASTTSPPTLAPPPLEASSGQVVRHRLSRAGDRKLNHALYMRPWSRSAGPAPGGPITAQAGRGRVPQGSPALLHWSSIGVVTRSPGSWLLGRRQGTASLLCRQTASFSPAAPGAPRPSRPASGTRPVEGRTMKNRRQGLGTSGVSSDSTGRPDVCRLGLGQHHP
jgi:hypothetical protein